MKKLVIEFNETGFGIPDFSGKEVTRKLLQELQELDNVPRCDYFKFYFEVIENGECTKKIRLDLGCGVRSNSAAWNVLEKELG